MKKYLSLTSISIVSDNSDLRPVITRTCITCLKCKELINEATLSKARDVPFNTYYTLLIRSESNGSLKNGTISQFF